MKTKAIVLVILTVILLVITSMIFVTNNNIENISDVNNKSSNNAQVVTQNSPEIELKTFDKLSVASVRCSNEVDDVISTNNAEFEIEFDQAVSEEYVSNTFSLQALNSNGNVEFQIVKVSPQIYRLSASNELEEGTIYNVIETTTEGVTKWAFQTEQNLKVEYTYPRTGATLESNGGFEIEFNNPIKNLESLKEFITIEPAINGYWEEQYSNRYIFRHPEENFVENNKYTVKVKSGLEDIYGNTLKEDFETYFVCRRKSQKSNMITNIQIDSENVFNTNEKVSFAVYVYADADEGGITINQNEFKIYEISSYTDYIDVLRNIDTDINYAQKIFNDNEYKLILKKEATTKSKIEEKMYFDVFQIDTDFSSSDAGYYIALVRINDQYQIHAFQINDNMASLNFLSTKEAIIIYKNIDNKNNSIPVYVNNCEIGKTDSKGLLYIENTDKVVKNYDKEFNYLKINCETPLVFDVTGSLGFVDTSWENFYYDEGDESRDVYIHNYDLKTRIISRHNNGYIYNDRPIYKVGETVNLFGYAKNRVYGVKEARINISCGSSLIDDAKLELDSQGLFKYQFKLDNVNSGSYVEAKLLIDGQEVYSRYIRVLDYSTSAYAIDVAKEGYTFIEGEETNVKITATTFDGVPLPNTVFVANTEGNISTGNVTIGDDGIGYGVVKFTTGNGNSIYPTYPSIRYDNSLLDGNSKRIDYRVFPYKNYYQTKMEYNKEDNTYTLEFNEYTSKDKNIAANDTIEVTANAMYEVRTVRNTYYDEYYKEERKNYDYNQYPNAEYNKTYTVEIVDGKGSITFPNWSDGTNEMGYYALYTYLKTEDGRSLEGWSDYNTVYNVYGWNRYEDEYENWYDSNLIQKDGTPVITKKDNIPAYHIKVDSIFTNYNQEIEMPLIDGTVYDSWEGSEINVINGDKIAPEKYDDLEIFLFVVSGKGTEIKQFIHEPIKFVYEEEFGANIEVYPIIYDGSKIYSPNFYDNIFGGIDNVGRERQFRFGNRFVIKTEDLKLNIDISFDKEIYKPGEEAVIKIKTTHNEKGVKSGVNLSAVDAAYTDENGSTEVSILDTLLNPYGFNIKEISSHLYIPLDTNQGGGGGGDGGADRTQILTTAFFENVITDNNGNAEIKVKLPDNITEWEVTTQGISEDYRAGSKISKLIVSKDYYVALTHKDKYIEDELFAFNVKSFGKKYMGNETLLKVSILDSNNKVIESGDVETKVGVVSSYKIKNGLKTGKYKIKLSGTLNGKSDTLIEEFEVRKNLLEILSRETLELKPNDEIEVISPMSKIYVLNEDVEKNLGLLFELMSLRGYGNRNDSTIISDAAYSLYNKLRVGKGNLSKDYKDTDAIMRLMENSSYDVDLALRNFAVGNVRKDVSAVNYIGNQKGEYAKTWALAACGEPVLKTLKNMYKEVSKDPSAYTTEKILYVALGLAEIGDFDDANSLYENVKTTITENDEKEYILLTILSIKINSDDRNTYYKNLLSKQMMPEVINYIKLYYLQNEFNRNTKEGKLILFVDNDTKNIKINNIGYTEYNVNNKHKYSVKDISDNIKVMLEDYKPIDTSLYESKGIISKSYSNNNPKEGELVSVTITVNRDELLKLGNYGIYTIQDVIPNNMNYVETIYSNKAWYCRKDGQKIEFHLYTSEYDRDKSNPTMTYQIRVSNNGEQKESGTVLTNLDNEILDIIK